MRLDDPAMRAWLAEAAVARNRPVLVSGEGRRRRVHTGPAIAVVLVRRRGPRAALRVLRAVAGQAARGHVASHGEAVEAGVRSTRRGLLRAGLAGAAMLAVGGPARASAAASTSTVIGAAAPSEVSTLQGSAATETAARVFGRPDWASVARDQEFAGAPRRFTTPFWHDKHGVVFVSEAELPDDPAFALRPVSGEGRLDLYLVDGAPLASVRVGRTSATVELDALPPNLFADGAAPQRPYPRAFYLCFRTCLEARGLGDALLPCWSCLNSPSEPASWPACAECAALAGNAFAGCIRQCAASR